MPFNGTRMDGRLQGGICLIRPLVRPYRVSLVQHLQILPKHFKVEVSGHLCPKCTSSRGYPYPIQELYKIGLAN